MGIGEGEGQAKRRERMRWIEQGGDKRRVLERVHHDETVTVGRRKGRKGKKDVVTATRTVIY